MGIEELPVESIRRNFEGFVIYQFILQCYESRSVEKQVNPINFPKAAAFPPLLIHSLALLINKVFLMLI